jgi:DNA segregation ATPase FtsK/SpoIIIE-like protein
LSRLAAIGGEFGLHLVLATQYPQIKMLGSAELKRNVTTRLCGKVDDANAASNALGLTGTGAEDLQGYGDFLLRDFSGLARLTVAKIEAHHVADLPRGAAKILDLSAIDTGNVPDTPKAHYHDPDPLEPGPLALALFEPMGINRLARTIKERGLAETFSNDKAQRYLEFAGLMWEAARQMGYGTLPPSHPGLPSGIRD